MRVTASVLIATLLVTPAYAARLQVDLEIPRINVAEYHRPYVAVWVEGQDQRAVADLAVWYQQRDGKEGHGTKWLPDLRQWWRKSGRSQTLPVDGVSGPTKPAGHQTITVDARHPALTKLAPGNYTLVVEAAREVGGRELVKVPFAWNGKASTQHAQGRTELGAVSVAVSP